MFRKSVRIFMIVAVLALTVAYAPGAMASPDSCATSGDNTFAKLLECVTLDGVRAHQAAFQAIADANGGTRAAGTPGYDASLQYVVDTMTAAGYNVSVNAFPFTYVALPTLQQTAPIAASYETGAFTGSGFGNISAAVTAVDINLVPPRANTSGCEAADFAGFPVGNIALLQRGTCTFTIKATNAFNAGASAVIIFNQGDTPARSGLIIGNATGSPSIVIVGASFDQGAALSQPGSTASITLVAPQLVTQYNVIAESKDGDPNNVVMAGGHLDSVPRGPGINDNGSGSAALLEVAEQMANVKPVNKVRFAWWGAEEAGLVGSTAYVNGLSQAERDQIALYLNFDMVGSPNHVFFIYDGDNSDAVGAGPGPAGSAEIEKTFERFFHSVNTPFKGTDFSGRSDYGPFIAVGIPSGGLFTGAEGIKTADEVALWGGVAGQQYDQCYHLACDTFANVNLSALDVNSDAIAYATLQSAMNAVELSQVSEELQAILNANPGTPLADKVEDVLAKTQSASAELGTNPPDLQAAIGNIEGAIGDLEAAVKDGLLGGAQGTQLMNLLSAAARQFAAGAINEAIAGNGDPSKIAEAQGFLADGDALRASGNFKDAVSKYKDALSKAS